jgi:hypothetical protein
MSGGSYNYVFSVDAEELFDSGRLNDLVEIRARLRMWHDQGAIQAWRSIATLDYIIGEVTASKAQVQSQLEPIRALLKAVEWHDSSDWGFDEVTPVISRYERGENHG